MSDYTFRPQCRWCGKHFDSTADWQDHYRDMVCVNCGTHIGLNDDMIAWEAHIQDGCRKIITAGPNLTTERRFRPDPFDRGMIPAGDSR